MKKAFALAISGLAACLCPAASGATSPAYNTGNPSQFCELRIGTRPPAALRPTRSWQEPTEGDPIAYKEYRLCMNTVSAKTEIADGIVSSVHVEQAGVCVDGDVCIGSTLAAARKKFPSARIFLSQEEGDTLSLLVSDRLTFVFDPSGLSESCFADAKVCDGVIATRKIKAIYIHN